MSEFTEKLKKLKSDIVLAFEGFQNPQPQVAAEVTEVVEPQVYEGALTTGEIVRATPSLATGSIFSIVSENGDLPAPDGLHQLADGTSVEVINGTGEISTVTLPTPTVQPPVPPAPPLAMSEEVKAEFEAVKKINSELTEKLTSTESKLAEMEAKFSKMEGLIKLSVDGFVMLADMPVGEPTKKVATEKIALSSADLIQEQVRKIEEFKKSNIKVKK